MPCLLLQGVQHDGHESQAASTLLIYCHANSEDLGSIYACAQWISQMMGMHVLVPGAAVAQSLCLYLCVCM